MSEPIWVDLRDILAIQEQLLARFGGLSGVRDAGLLESAQARPLQLRAYGKPSLFELAAAYSHGIVKNHPFLDGNKRAGFMAAYTFLGANGWELDATEESAALQTIGLAAGEVSEEEYAAWLKKSCVRIKKTKGKT